MSQAPAFYYVPLDNADNEEAHRRILSIDGVKPGKKRAWLALVDIDDGQYRIPLGSVHTVAKGTTKPEWDTVLVPVVPLRYTSPEEADTSEQKRRFQAAPLRRGWLYVYKDGHLWRELEVGPRNYFADVNLTTQQNKDVRIASVERDNRVLLPYKLDNEKPALQVCYSEVQWSWERINQMGGMAPDDPRLNAATRLPSAEQKAGAEQRLHERMGEALDLSSYPRAFQTDTGNIGAIDEAKCFAARIHHGTKIPALYLEDVLGIARRLHAEYYDAAIKQAEYIEQNKTPATIAHIDDAILKQKPDYAKHLREDERKEFQRRYKHKLEELGKTVTERLNADIDYRSSEPAASRLLAAQRDFLPGHTEAFEEMLRDIYVGFDFARKGREFVSRQFNAGGGAEPVTDLQLFWSLTDKATAATDGMLQLVAEPLALKDKWDELVRYTQDRYGLALAQHRVALPDFEKELHQRSPEIAAGALEVSAVQAARTAREVPPKVWSITVDGRLLGEAVRKVLDSREYAGAFLALQLFNLYRAARALGEHYNNHSNGQKKLQLSMDFASSAIGTGTATTFLYTAGLKARAGMLSDEVRQAAMKAEAEATERAALRVAGGAAFLEVIADLLHVAAEFRAGNAAAARDYGIIAAGDTVAGAGLYILGEELASNPVGWLIVLVGVAISIAGGTRLAIDDTKPIEDWMKHGYWGQRAYQDEGERADGEPLYYSEWKGHLRSELDAYYRIACVSTYHAHWALPRPTGYVGGAPEYSKAEFELTLSAFNADPHRSRFHLLATAEPGGDVLIGRRGQSRPKYSGGANGTPARLQWTIPVAPTKANLIHVWVSYDPFGDNSMLFPEDGCTFTLQPGWTTAGARPLLNEDYGD